MFQGIYGGFQWRSRGVSEGVIGFSEAFKELSVAFLARQGCSSGFEGVSVVFKEFQMCSRIFFSIVELCTENQIPV